jgi:phosphate transport system substrate-binding protein
MRHLFRRIHLPFLALCCWQAASAAELARPHDIFPWAEELPKYEPSTPVRGTLHSVGADTMDEITFGWIRQFRRLHPDLVMTMEARGSLTAAPALTSGLANISPVARELLPSELAAFEQRFGYKPTAIRVAGGSYATKGRTHALAVIVHRDNPITQISFAQLDAIYSAVRRRGGEEILTWGQLGLTGEWADRPVVPYGLRRPNGIVNFFQSRVMLGGEFKTGVRERESPRYIEEFEPVMQSVAADPCGIAYATFAQHTTGIKAIAVSASPAGPFVEGTYGNVLNQSYPLTRTVNIYVNRPPGQPLDPKIKEFLKFVLSREGQRIVAADSAFLPLPPHVVREELAKLEATPNGAAAGGAAPRSRD